MKLSERNLSNIASGPPVCPLFRCGGSSKGEHHQVGQPELDAQHRAIFDIALEVADLAAARRSAATQGGAAKLEQALQAHFAFAERQFADTDQARKAEHRDQHRVLLAELHAIGERLDRMRPDRVPPKPGFVVLGAAGARPDCPALCTATWKATPRRAQAVPARMRPSTLSPSACGASSTRWTKARGHHRRALHPRRQPGSDRFRRAAELAARPHRLAHCVGRAGRRLGADRRRAVDVLVDAHGPAHRHVRLGNVARELRAVATNRHCRIGLLLMAGLAGSYYASGQPVGDSDAAGPRRRYRNGRTRALGADAAFAAGACSLGWLGDRHGRRRTLALACTGALLCWTIVTLGGALSPAALGVLMFALGFCSGSFNLVYALVTQHKLRSSMPARPPPSSMSASSPAPARRSGCLSGSLPAMATSAWRWRRCSRCCHWCCRCRCCAAPRR